MPKTPPPKAKDAEALLGTLKTRFERHKPRHPRVAWADVQARLQAQPAALTALNAMERSGGEPDVVVGVPGSSGAIVFCDCADESPAGRRSLCYDAAARDARKENQPAHSALGLAAELGVTLLDEAQYRALQTLGEFDAKTSSWVATPPSIRALGGALFCDRRYGTVFTYHNGAQSYYAARGFRAWLGV
jgi:Protein of unknown function (DUF4256)